MTKITQAPASVVRTFLNDPAVWATVYCEDEEFLVDGETRIDLNGVADTAMVAIKGGDIYAQKGGSRLNETLKDVFDRYMASGITVVVRADESRQTELLDLLASRGFQATVVSNASA